MDRQEKQIEASLLCEYIVQYSKLERIVKNCFSRSVQTNLALRNELYFYLGSKSGNIVNLDFQKKFLFMDKQYFKEDEKFESFTMNNIVKWDQQRQAVEDFGFEIPSIYKPMLLFSFHDSCVKLMKMRNKIAHEMDHLEFKDSDFVELMSKEQIISESPEILEGFDLQKISYNAICIYSNLKTIAFILHKLQGECSENDS